MTYGITCLTANLMIIQQGAEPMSETEKGWTGKGMQAIKMEVESQPVFGIKWKAEIQGSKIICKREDSDG